MSPSIRAFRFNVGSVPFAFDIQGDVTVLLFQGPQGWEQSEEMPAVISTPESITRAGGPVQFVHIILEAINRALRIIQGKPRDGDIPKPQDPTPQADVLAYMQKSVVAHTLMDGTVELQVR